MRYTIRRLCANGYLNYIFKEESTWVLWGNRSDFFSMRQGNMTLMENQEVRCVAIQKNIFRHICESVPVLNMFVSNPYLISTDGYQIGTIYRPCGGYGYIGTVNGIQYEYRLHSCYVWSLVRDNQQIAVLKYEKGGQYTVSVGDIDKNDLGWLLLMCGCFDRGSISNTIRIGTNYIPGDKYQERAYWQPNE